MGKIKFLSVLVLLAAVLLSAYPGVGMAQEPLIAPPQPIKERPRELTETEYQNEVAGIYAQHPDLSVVVDLKDPAGIDLDLLPPDVAALVDSNTRIVSFKETARPISRGRVPGLASPCSTPVLGVGCKSASGSRDMTVSNWFGGVEQFGRVYALRYDWYPPCGSQNCKGWEIEQQWAWWKRNDSGWTVQSAQMWTKILGENYCTQQGATLDYGSSYFTPTWYGNQTGYWSISGFPNNAYVPFPSGWSRTQGDIYQGSSLKYNDAMTYQFWSKD